MLTPAAQQTVVGISSDDGGMTVLHSADVARYTPVCPVSHEVSDREADQKPEQQNLRAGGGSHQNWSHKQSLWKNDWEPNSIIQRRERLKPTFKLTSLWTLSRQSPQTYTTHRLFSLLIHKQMIKWAHKVDPQGLKILLFHNSAHLFYFLYKSIHKFHNSSGGNKWGAGKIEMKWKNKRCSKRRTADFNGNGGK